MESAPKISMIEIDGSSGEGGGQILRTSLALSLVTGQAFRISNIRANRQRPGLQRQHLAAVEAATQLGNADVEGAMLGSRELVFQPGKLTSGNYSFSTGSAGSATLVLQTVLPALLVGSGKSILTLEGGTHNPMAPPFDFLEKTFVPLINRMGPRISATLLRHGFYPAGGGKCIVEIEPATSLSPLTLTKRGAIQRCHARAIVARLSREVAQRELNVIAEHLGWRECTAEQVSSPGPGNVVVLEIETDTVTEVIVGFGERGVRAETIAGRAAEEARIYCEAGAPVGEHLADQLLLPLALAGGGAFKTIVLSQHSTTNIETIKRFLPVKFAVEEHDDGWTVAVEG